MKLEVPLFKRMRKRRGQTTAETLLLLAVVSMGMLFALQQLWHKPGPVRDAAEQLAKGEQEAYGNGHAVK